jgi:tetratricopeptide (TPR) repeat protein
MRNTSAANIDDYGNKALEYELEALNIREKLLEPGHLDIARSYDNLEKIHEYRGEWKEAISYGKKLIEFYRTYFDPLYPLLAGAYNNTAIVLREDMQKDQSIAFSEKALEIAGKSYGEIHLEMAYANWTLSNTYVKFGDREKALSCMNTTVSILEKLLSPDHPNMILACDTRNKLRS